MPLPIEDLPNSDAVMKPRWLRVNFIALWLLLTLLKVALASRLPLFVDEAFYAWEGRFPAWAYSDLPGLTAWLSRLGSALGGSNLLALRAPFLLVGAAVPWLVVRISRRWFGRSAGWRAGLLALLMPLSGLLGLLALPDVPLVFAALLCLDAIGSLRERQTACAFVLLAAGLVVGGLSHYRFALVVFAGLAGMAWDRQSRRLLARPSLLLALAAGALAWLPLLSWNLHFHGAGLRFQLVDRNPWTFHADGALWLPIQCLLLTPPLFVLLLQVMRHGWQLRDREGQPWRLVLGVALVSVLGYLLLGFFADEQRVSFHWPLAGWLVLVAAAPVVLQRWPAWARRLVYATAGFGLAGAIAFVVCAATPGLRRELAFTAVYPADFAGWSELFGRMSRMPVAADTQIVAGDFEVGAQLAFALDRRDVHVLDSLLNHKHGRAAQLDAWGLRFDDLDQAAGRPVLLVINDTATPMKDRLVGYQRLCRQFGALPSFEVLAVDHGSKRYLIYRFERGQPRRPGCTAPALAWIDSPARATTLPPHFEVSGWAFKDGPGLKSVQVTVDGREVQKAQYGAPMPGVAAYWQTSTDPAQPRVGFRAQVDASSLAAGRHWLGLRLRGADGSDEPWAEQRINIKP